MVSRVCQLPILLLATSMLCLSVAGAQDVNSPFFDSAIQNLLVQVSDTALAGSIRSLQSFGTRHWGNPNRKSVAEWIQARFVEFGVSEVVLDSFQYSGTWQWNVVATIPGVGQPAKEIVFGAHTDATTSIAGVAPGADDNASGVAGILEIARVLRQTAYQPKATFRFIGFAAEEAGLRGSTDYAGRAHSRAQPIKAMINFDMIGYRPRGTTQHNFNVVMYDPWPDLATLDSLMAVTYTSLTPGVTTANRTKSDSYPFSQRGIPSVFLFDGGTSVAYHTQHDIVDSLDLMYAAEIVRTGLATALSLDAENAASGDAGETELPAEFALHQNYPNPFNPSTTIVFSVARSTPVTVKVYDLVGREVATLAQGTYVPGMYALRWDAGGAAAGSYFCRMGVEGRVFTRQMILVR